MTGDDWESIEFLKDRELEDYLCTLDEDSRARELELYGKYYSNELLKEHMKKFSNFYSFVKDYSPCDFRLVRNKPHVSQRVIVQHVQMWNDIHCPKKIKTLRVFFT